MLVPTAELFPLARIQSLSAEQQALNRGNLLSFGNYCALLCALLSFILTFAFLLSDIVWNLAMLVV